MANRQFFFSLSVGITFTIFGFIIFTQAAVGLSLMALGAAIAVLAFFTRDSHQRSQQPQALPISRQALQSSPK